MKRRFIVIVLCLCVVFSLLPSTALAADGDTEREARLYQLLLEGIRDKKGLDGESYIDLSELGLSSEAGSADSKMLDAVFSRVLFDHPELYYITECYRYVSTDATDVLGIRPVYVNAARDPDAQDRFDAAISTALAQIEGLTDPVEQILALYNHLVRTTAYLYEAAAYDAPVNLCMVEPKEAWTAYGALVTGDTVCKGYAMAWKVLMDRIGIPCLVVCKGDGSHLWNMVQLDGKWYHIDVNGGNNILPVLRGQCMYKDFLVTDTVMSKHGSWFIAGYGTCPDCTDERFSTGWLFRQNYVFYPIYRDKSGQYYYIRYIDVKTAKLCCGQLCGEERELAVLSPYTVFWDTGNLISSGVVWSEDCLYYVNAEFELISYRLSDGESVSLGRIPFTPQATVDGCYDKSRDGIGLLFDEHSGVLSAQSRNRETVLKTWQIALPQMEFEDVTFDITYYNSTNGSIEHEQVKKGDSFTVKAAPDGYGWATRRDAAKPEYFGGERVTPNGNMELYLVKKSSKPAGSEDPANPEKPEDPTPGTPNTWQNTPNGWQYLGADGKPLTGSNWIEALGHRYVFNDNGILQTGNATGDLLWKGNQYYLNPDRNTNDPTTCYCVINYTRRREAGVTYYNQDGITYRGWVDGGNGKLLYQTVLLGKDGKELKDEAGFSTYIYVWGGQQIPEGRDPLDAKKMIAAGNYLFGEDGVLVTGRTGWYIISGSSAIAGEYYLTGTDGQCALNTTIWDDAKGHRYLFGADGRKVSAGKDGLDVALTINGQYQTVYLAPNTDYVACEYYRPRKDSKGTDRGLTYYNPDGITYRGWVDGGNGKRLYQTVMDIQGVGELYFIVWHAQYLPAGKDPVTKDPIPAGWYLFDDNGVLITKDGTYTYPDTKGVDHQYQVKGGVIVARDGEPV